MESKLKISDLIITLVVLVALVLIIGIQKESKSDIAARIKSKCTSGPIGGKETCYSKEFEGLASKQGPKFSFDVLHLLQGIDPKAKGCHLISHGIGEGSYRRDPKNWQGLIENMPMECNYGSIHGVIQGYIGSLPDKTLTKEIIPSICGQNPRADCNHIVGHLILVETDTDVSKALDFCEVFSDVGQRDFCQTGVFMEYSTALNLINHGLVPKSWLNWPARLDEIEKLCRSYDREKAINCWTEIVHVALVKFNNDPNLIFNLCDKAPLAEATKRCKRHSLGVMAASRQFDLANLKYICHIPQKNDSNFEDECYGDFVSSTLSTIPTMISEVVSFCRSLDKKFESSCLSVIDNFRNQASHIKTND